MTKTMTKPEIDKLVEYIAELDDDRGFGEFPGEKLLRVSGAAALFMVGDKQLWFPFKTLRHLDGEIYASDWILEQKGLT
jgi:hypothetical protein